MRLLGVIAAFIAVLPLSAYAVSSEIHFTADGNLTAKNLTVFQKSGNNLFTRATWDRAFIRVTLIPNASTTVLKAHGEAGTIADVKEQDILDIDGTLVPGADTIVINVSAIRDHNLQTAGKTLSGTILSLDQNARLFVINDKEFGRTSVSVSGASLMKGVRPISFGDLKVGDKVTAAVGAYDYAHTTLTADSIAIYQDASVFKPQNFQGKLKSLSGTTLPATAVITVGSTDYTVYFGADTTILNTARRATSLTRFVVGDTVRFYGSIRETNLSEVDSDTLRDLNF
jgi:hypothetical protein